MLCMSVLWEVNGHRFLLASFCCFLHREGEQKIGGSIEPILCVPQLNVKYFERNDWSKLAVNVISLDGRESKGHLCFSSELFYRDLVYKQRSLKLLLSSWHMYVFRFVCVCFDTWLMWCRTPCLFSSVLPVAFTYFLIFSRYLSISCFSQSHVFFTSFYTFSHVWKRNS